MGWSVIPTGRDKRPLLPWKEYQTNPAGEEQARQWWANETNVAACTGAVSGFVVVDVDNIEAIDRLHEYIGGKPTTPAVSTPRGMHYYFKAPDVTCKNQVNIIPGVDFRGDGGYVIMPPSVNEDGEIYEWITHPAECLMAELPARVLERVRADKPRQKRNSEPQEALSSTSSAGNTRYGQMALQSEISTLQNATQGQRNQTLNNCAFSLYQLCAGGELSETDVREQLTQTALAIGLSETEIKATLRSAHRAAEREPRTAPPLPPASPAFSLKTPPATETGVGPAPADPGNSGDLGDYFEKNGNIYFMKPAADEKIPVLVCRCAARIVEEIYLEDGETLFRIEGETATGRRFRFEISAKEFSEDKTLKAALMNAAGSDIYIRSGMMRHVGPAITYISDPEQIDRHTQYKRTGWLDKSTFLIPGRELTRDELVLERDLPFELTASADLETGLKALHELACAQPLTASTVALTTLFTAPLAFHAGWHNNRSGAFITGRTGSLKSSFAGCAMCLYGPEWINDQTWISWGDTVNAIMSICVQAHDLPILIDNYKPVVHAGARELIRLIHSIFEGGEKRRLNRNSERRQHRKTLTWPIITGEDVPDSDASTIARMLIIQFPVAGVDNKTHITYAQENSQHLCAVGGAWLDWLTTPEGQTAANEAGEKFNRYRARWSRKLSEATPGMVNVQRVATNLSINQLTWECMTACPALADFCTNMASHHAAGLEVVGQNMGERTRESLEANRFLDTLGDILASKKFILLDRFSDATNPGDLVLGWQDESQIYLLMKPAIKAVTDYLGKDGLGLISERTLYKQLDDIGAIAEKGGKTVTKFVRCSNQPVRVLILKRGAVWPDVVDFD